MWIPRVFVNLLNELRKADREALEAERGRVDRLLTQLQGMNVMYERQVAALRVGHAAAIARADRAENELGRSKATIEWMTSHLNVVEHRSASLEHRLFATNPIVPTIDAAGLRDTPPVTTRMDGEMAGTTVEDERFSAMVEDESVNALFEDIGDRRARAQGIEWDEVGAVVRTR
jgi:hypothetical protein